ncbi:DsrE family protein [Alteromonas aestuariivivens]|nr:DsrE family protein [Alteromonas aestuariivivens]
MSDANDKFLVHCQEGENNLERATISLILATTASKTCEAALFVTADATELFVKGRLAGLQAPGHEPLEDLVNQYQANGGQIWICPVCVKVKGLSADDFIDGVEIAGAPRAMAFLSSGGHMLA